MFKVMQNVGPSVFRTTKVKSACSDLVKWALDKCLFQISAEANVQTPGTCTGGFLDNNIEKNI